MSSPNDEFEPEAAVVEAVLSELLTSELRRFERELRRPIAVEGHTTVRGEAAATWRLPPTRKSGEPLSVEARATFRRTGGAHILFRVQVRAPRSGATSWTGLTLEGFVWPDRVPISAEPRGKTVLHNQSDWLAW